MAYEDLEVETLLVNQANDRHGEVGSEDLAIAELFRLHDAQMRNLAADIASVGAVYDPPLVMPFADRFVVFDGNRRVTCLKLLTDPARAPTADLQAYFARLCDGMDGDVPNQLVCQIEDDRNLIDSILFRRHTGSQGGVGQLAWNDRAKLNFVERTGRGEGVNVASEVDRLLTDANRLPDGNIGNARPLPDCFRSTFSGVTSIERRTSMGRWSLLLEVIKQNPRQMALSSRDRRRTY